MSLAPPHEMYSDTTGKGGNVPEYLDSGILKRMNPRLIVYFFGGRFFVRKKKPPGGEKEMVI
jgi:hypothetical protein